MKKISRGSFHELPPTILFSNDVVRLCDLLKDGGHSSIRLRSADFELESPSEFEELAKTVDKGYVSHLHITARDPHVSIEFEPYSARVYISEDTNALRGLLVKITELVEKRKRRVWRFTQNFLPSLPIGASVYAFLEKRLEIALPLLLLGTVWHFWTFRQSTQRYSTIWLKPKEQAPGFFERNKDKLVLAVLSGILGALAKALFDWLERSGT